MNKIWELKMKIVGKIIILLGFILFAVGLFVTACIYPDFFNSSLIPYFAILIAIFGVCFSFAQNKTIANFGTAFSVFSGLFGYLILNRFFKDMDYYRSSYKGEEVTIVVAVGLFIMLIGAMVTFMLQLLNFIEHKNK